MWEMFKEFILCILLCVITSTSYATSAPCASPDEVDEYILSTFKEEKVWVGITNNTNKTQQLTFLYENPDTGGWTIAFYDLERDITCIVAGGESSSYVTPKKKGSNL